MPYPINAVADVHGRLAIVTGATYGDLLAMTSREFVKVPGLGWLKLVVDKRQTPKLTIGDRVGGFGEGLVVEIDEDAVVVARRNANGRYMELVFVGKATRMLRSQ